MISPYQMLKLSLGNVAVTVEYIPGNYFSNAFIDPTKEQYETAILLCQDTIERLNADKEKRYGKHCQNNL